MPMSCGVTRLEEGRYLSLISMTINTFHTRDPKILDRGNMRIFRIIPVDCSWWWYYRGKNASSPISDLLLPTANSYFCCHYLVCRGRVEGLTSIPENSDCFTMALLNFGLDV